MNKREILKLYISDLRNMVAPSKARDNRIAMLEEELNLLNLNSFCSHHKDPQNQCSYLSWFKNCGKCDSLKIKK